MTEKEALRIFDECGAFLTGHFRLSSGLHSENYLQCALVLQHPKIAQKMAKEIAKRFAKEKVDLVIGPALGGITFAYETARALGARGIFTERQDGIMVLRRGFSIAKGERALVVEDVITTGGSTKEVMGLVKKIGAEVVGVGCVIDRSESDLDLGVRKECLARLEIKTFNPDECPLCKSNIPLIKPGSRK